MLRTTVEKLDECGRVIEVTHKYQDVDNAAKFVNEVTCWGIQFDIDNDRECRVEDNMPKRLNVFLEEIDEKGNAICGIRIY